jgi:hypothetical protein
VISSIMGAAALCSGCIVWHTDRPSFTEPCLEQGEDFACCMSASPDRDRFGAIFLPTYVGEGFPFSVVLRLNDYAHQYSEISISEVEVEYGKGSIERISLDQVHRCSWKDDASCDQAEAPLERVVRHRGATAITLIGELRRADGRADSLRMRRELRFDSKTEFATWYEVIANC